MPACPARPRSEPQPSPRVATPPVHRALARPATFAVTFAVTLAVTLAGLLLPNACTAPPPTPRPPSPPPTTPLPMPATDPPAAPVAPPPIGSTADLSVVTPLRALTHRELLNTYADLLGRDFPDVSVLLPASPLSPEGFRVGLTPEHETVTHALFRAAAALARAAEPRLASLLPAGCATPAEPEASACAARFIADFGRRAFRRPLAAAEADALIALYQRRRGEGEAFGAAITTVLEALLQSPQLLYRWELGPDERLVNEADGVRLGPWQIASRLSYGLWETMPDERLLAAADSGELMQPARVLAEAARLLADPRAAGLLAEFHLQWLDVAGLPDQIKEGPVPAGATVWTPALVRSVLEESSRLAIDVYQGTGTDGSWRRLLTSPHAFVDAGLAAFYGVSGVVQGWQPVTLDPNRRGGLLTRAAFLAAHAGSDVGSPPRRGTTLLRRLFCIDVPPEGPEAVDVQPIALPPTATNRQRFEAHGLQNCARVCHDLIDPPGFAFEHYDGLGRFRSHDNGQAVNASAVIRLPTRTFAVTDALDLGAQIALFDEPRACLARRWFRHLAAREVQGGDAASLGEAVARFESTGFDLRALVTTLTATRAFRSRALSAGEARP